MLRRSQAEAGSKSVRPCHCSSACHIAAAVVEKAARTGLVEAAGIAVTGVVVGIADVRFDRCSSRPLHHDGP